MRPWWRRPSFVGAATAVAVAVIGGWLQQGGISLIENLFSDEGEVIPPRVSVKMSDDPMCTTWLLRGDPHQVADKLSQEFSRDAPDATVDLAEQIGIADRIRREAGARLPTGRAVEVAVQGSKGKDVVLTGLDVVVKSRNRQVPGKLMGIGVGCGDVLTPRQYKVSFDDLKPSFKLLRNFPDGTPNPKAVDFPYKVSPGDPEYFVLLGSAKGFAEWTAKLRWISDGEQGETEINDKGRPFMSFPSDSVTDDFYYNNRTFTLTENSRKQ
ncbi:hypothetical protein [Streptomyces albireticuli]|uniref:hypothetical protein n=1 Tax=Streptomyces albireticuli TaxID=1940 RepID=UPI00117BE253|nr:hypothetical protein [Streptomyces albireticuli]MCD9146015.1 hypothetical protein [Streptomyces albireticuli]MCD9166245.1 hypothetical protein [Streptomyces albireticuli]MCD9196566.1 hypothetical protein [Streptomyces albireticuli]